MSESTPNPNGDTDRPPVQVGEIDRMYLTHLYNSYLQNELRRDVFIVTYHLAFLIGFLSFISGFDESVDKAVEIWYSPAYVALFCHFVAILTVAVGFSLGRSRLNAEIDIQEEFLRNGRKPQNTQSDDKESDGVDDKSAKEPFSALNFVNFASLYSVPIVLICWIIFLFCNRSVILG